LAKVLQRK